MLLLDLFFLLLLLSAPASSEPSPEPPSSPANSTTIADILPKYALPPFLFPATSSNLSLAANGCFQLRLAAPCYADFEYLLYYDVNISGVLRYGGIDDLKGVQVRKFLIWFDVDRVMVDLPPSDFIYLDFGWIRKKFGLAQFEKVWDCKEDKKKKKKNEELCGVVLDQLPEPESGTGLLMTE